MAAPVPSGAARPAPGPPALLVAVALVALAALASSDAPARAEDRPDPLGLVIVVNDALDVASIDDEEIRRLFLGKSRRLPDGSRAALASYAPEASFFNERLLGLSDAEVAGVWSRLRFSGRSPVPRTFDTAAEVAAFVARTPNAIAYLPAGAPREGSRVLANLPR